MTTEPLPDEVIEALDAGHRVEAIRRLREATGISLAAARSRIEAHGVTAPDPAGSAEPSADVLAAIDAGRKIQAIRLLRDQTGLGLRDARLRVEALAEQRMSGRFEPVGGLRPVVVSLLGIAVLYAVYRWLNA